MSVDTRAASFAVLLPTLHVYLFPGRPSNTRSYVVSVDLQMKAQYMPNHVFIGIFTYFAAAFTAVIGIQDKNSANSCGYDITLTEPDYNPASHYWNLYAGCRLSNGLGELVVSRRNRTRAHARQCVCVCVCSLCQQRPR